jgi:hypothetical protein
MGQHRSEGRRGSGVAIRVGHQVKISGHTCTMGRGPPGHPACSPGARRQFSPARHTTRRHSGRDGIRAGAPVSGKSEVSQDGTVDCRDGGGSSAPRLLRAAEERPSTETAQCKTRAEMELEARFRA